MRKRGQSSHLKTGRLKAPIWPEDLNRPALVNSYKTACSHTLTTMVSSGENGCVLALSAVSSPDRPVEPVSTLSSAASWSDEKFVSLTSHTPGDALRGRGLPGVGFVCFIVLFEKIICIKTDWQADNNKEWVRINLDYWGSINDIFERIQWAAAAAPAGRSLGKHIFGSTPSAVRGRKEDSTGLSRPGSKLVSGQIGARLPLKENY